MSYTLVVYFTSMKFGFIFLRTTKQIVQTVILKLMGILALLIINTALQKNLCARTVMCFYFCYSSYRNDAESV